MAVRKLSSHDMTLSRRERQIMDVLYELGSAAASDIQQRLPGKPSDSTVRTLLRILERKGVIAHTAEDLRYVYKPKVGKQAALRSAMERLVQTFFEGSAKHAVAAFLDPHTSRLSKAELDEIAAMIRKARQEAK